MHLSRAGWIHQMIPLGQSRDHRYKHYGHQHRPKIYHEIRIHLLTNMSFTEWGGFIIWIQTYISYTLNEAPAVYARRQRLSILNELFQNALFIPIENACFGDRGDYLALSLSLVISTGIQASEVSL